MSLTISDAMQQAQEAIGGGNYRAAVQACSQLVRQYPQYAAAQRLLGEAYLEQGQNADAERAFHAALAGNPRHPWAWLGLGLIAEDRGANDPSLAYCQVAWELAPQLAQLREPVVRASTRRYGPEGRLQLTRAALAQLHGNAGRPRRAASEYQAALADLPDRVDLKLGLAESLWRLGRDSEAATTCAEVLRHHPLAAQGLAILADIERRGGNQRRADDLRAQLRAVDPDGAVVATLLTGNTRADHAWLEVAADTLPEISETAGPVVAERPIIAPAPDFAFEPTRPETRAAAPSAGPAAPVADAIFDTADLGDLQPMGLEEFGGSADMLGAAAGASEWTDLGFEDFSGGGGVGDDLDLPLDVQPFDPLEAGAIPGEQFPARADDTLFASSPASTAADAPTDFAALAEALDSRFDLLEGETSTPPVAAMPTIPSDDVEANRPPDRTPHGYTTMLRDLDATGLAPFDAHNRAAMATPSPADTGTGEDARDELTAMTQSWDDIDGEIQRAMPTGVTKGYTSELRDLQEIGLAPFALDPDDELDQQEQAASAQQAIDPVAAGHEPTIQSPALAALEQEPAPESPAQEHAAPPALPSDAAGHDTVFGDLQPFAAEDFDTTPADQQTRPFDFSTLPWESGPTRSIVPSDEDLEAMLAGEDSLLPVNEQALPAEPTDADQLLVESLAGLQTGDERTLEAELDQEHEHAVEPAEIEPAVTSDSATALETELESVDDEFAQLFDSSMAATRALDSAPVIDDEHFGGERMPEAQNPEFEAATVEAKDEVEPEDFLTTERIGTTFLDRARAVKEQLVSEGVIAGDRALDGEAADDEQYQAEPERESTGAPAYDDAFDTVAESMDMDDAPQSSGLPETNSMTVTRDTDTLRAALAADPHDTEIRWWLAEALRDRGDTREALAEYRWLIRGAPERAEAITQALTALAEEGQEAELAHRLLADIYRRKGDLDRAGSHAALALQQRR